MNPLNCFHIMKYTLLFLYTETKVFAGIVCILTLQKNHVQLDATRGYRGRIFEILYFVNFECV